MAIDFPSLYRLYYLIQYKHIIKMHPSIEARYHLSILYKETSEFEIPKKELHQLLADFNLHPKNVRKKNAKWYSAAKRELSSLKN